MFRRLLLYVVVASVVLGAIAAATLAQEAGPSTTVSFTEIDRYVQDEMDSSRIPGVAIAIVEGDRLVHSAGFGSAGDGRDITPRMPFPLGSNIKSFTALAIMQLVDAGEVELDAPVQQYLPWFQVADAEEAATITVRHLLNQTSGFSRQTGIAPLYEQRAMTLDEVVRDLENEALNRPVGESYEYSNANFTAAALIVQEVSGQDFGAYVEQQILDPLGMENSAATDDPAIRDAATDLYRFWFGFPRETEDAFLPERLPGEFLLSSAEDMARYLSMYLGDGTYEGVTVAEPESIALLTEPATNEATRQLLSTDFTFRYGMGWFVGPFGAGEDARWHLGQLPSFTAWMVLLPETNRGVVVLINASSQLEIVDANQVMSRIPIGVVNLLGGADAPSGRSLTTFYAGFTVIALAIIIIQLLALIRLLRRHLLPATGRQSGSAWRSASRIIPLIWEFGLGLAILLGWPVLTQLGWRGSWMSFPDLTIVLIVIATLWLITGLVRLPKLLGSMRSRRRRSDLIGGLPPTTTGSARTV
jgi:CubicO group peptidase (beta-lactamase class C family)